MLPEPEAGKIRASEIQASEPGAGESGTGDRGTGDRGAGGCGTGDSGGEARVWLAAGLAEQLAGAARAAFPAECCGLILGRCPQASPARVAGEAGGAGPGEITEPSGHGDEAVSWQILQAWPLVNQSTQPDRFEMAPQALFDAHRQARQLGLTIAGHYHSHPNGRQDPSPRDNESAFEAGVLWLIQPLLPGGLPESPAAAPSPVVLPLTAWISRGECRGFLPAQIMGTAPAGTAASG